MLHLLPTKCGQSAFPILHACFCLLVSLVEQKDRTSRDCALNLAAMASKSFGKNDVEIVDQPSHIESLAKPSHVTEIGTFRVVGLTPDDAAFYTSFPEEKRKRVFRKVDARLIPMLAVLYLICHIDRANIGNAKIEGMVQDLNMTGIQYNTVLSICEYLARHPTLQSPWFEVASVN
jgi:hypothetical protein